MAANKNELLFSKKNIKIELNSRLSDNYGAILIKDYKNNVIDYIIYYNSKKNSLEKLKEKKNYLKIVEEVKNEDMIDLKNIIDINGISINKHIVRVNDRFIIRQYNCIDLKQENSILRYNFNNNFKNS